MQILRKAFGKRLSQAHYLQYGGNLKYRFLFAALEAATEWEGFSHLQFYT